MADWSTITAACIVVFVVSRISLFYNGLRQTQWLSGIRCAFDPFSFPGGVLPSTWWNPGLNFVWLRKDTLHNKHDTISVVPFLSGHAQLVTSNLDVARQIVAGGVKSPWTKPSRISRGLLLWGVNLIAAERDTWRRHRRIVSPAFTNKLNAMVWNKTLSTYHEWMTTEDWANRDIVEVPRAQKDIFKLALLVIATCGFGVPFTWAEPPRLKNPDGSEAMTVQESLRIMSELNTLAALTPKWSWNLPFKTMRRLKAGHEELEKFMRNQVAERKAELRGEASDAKTRREDVFSLLIRANEAEDAEEPDTRRAKLDDQEVLSNVFILLVAGHETTAHTLSATMALLSVNPEIQQEVYEQIIEVVGHEREPTFEQYEKLNKVTSAVYEALRHFPAAAIMIRECTEDTVLNIPNPLGEEGFRACAMPKGTQVTVDLIGAQYNPRHYPEPEKYLPSRWYNDRGDEPQEGSDPVTAFSFGPRACIGRKFATYEATAFLTLMLRDWKIEPLLNEGETMEEWKKRVLDASIVFTLAIRSVPLKFTRRSSLRQPSI